LGKVRDDWYKQLRKYADAWGYVLDRIDNLGDDGTRCRVRVRDKGTYDEVCRFYVTSDCRAFIPTSCRPGELEGLVSMLKGAGIL